MAQRTSRLRLGTMLTPLPWRRPWKVAIQAATLDQLPDGRAILPGGCNCRMQMQIATAQSDLQTDARHFALLA